MKESKWIVHEPEELKTEYRTPDYRTPDYRDLVYLVQNPVIITDNGENKWGEIGGLRVSTYEIFRGHRYTMYVGLSKKGQSGRKN